MIYHAACLTSDKELIAQAVGTTKEEVLPQKRTVACVVGVGAGQDAPRKDHLHARLYSASLLRTGLDESAQLGKLFVNGSGDGLPLLPGGQ